MRGRVSFRELGKLGRFGNQLFQIAGTIGIAALNGRDAVFPDWKNSDHVAHSPGASSRIGIFKNSLEAIPDRVPARWANIRVPLHFERIRLQNGFDFNLSGFMQSEKYFEHVEAEIRRQFETIDRPSIIAKTVCSVHVRRGDYVGSIYTLPDQAYYSRAMAHMTSLGFKKFAVFSDDLPAARALLGPIADDIRVELLFDYPVGEELRGREKYLRDFCAIKSMGGHIISNSSFSWWAAWLSNEPHVIAPREWFLPGAPHSDRDIVPERWRTLTVER